MDLQFLMRLENNSEREEARSMVEITLDRISQGGICDQAGGGFYRHSTDRRWLVPHFEKMLYINVFLTSAYARAYVRFKKPRYRRVVEQTLGYVQREMSAPEGAFYSSQDAESEGEEGKYYLWDYDEFITVLEEEVELLADYWGVTPGGNFEGKNILHVSEPLREFCEERDIDETSFRGRIEEAREKLLSQREKRVSPGRDDKILADWNCSMASAFVRAVFFLAREEYQERGRRCLEFLRKNLVQNDVLYHARRAEEKDIPGFLADYAFYVKALLDFYQFTGRFAYLERAEKFFDRAVERFWDKNQGGFYQTTDRDDLIVRAKSPLDKAEPSGNSEIVLNAQKLAVLTGEPEYDEYARKTLAAFEQFMERSPGSMPRMLCGLYDAHHSNREVVIVGSEEERAPFLDVLWKNFSRQQFWPRGILNSSHYRNSRFSGGDVRSLSSQPMYVEKASVSNPPPPPGTFREELAAHARSRD